LTQSGAMGNVKIATKEKGDCLLASIFDDQEGLIKDIQSKILTNSVNQN
jgi:creatinine amidohydrolase/Fe(II)-dependent formamide hydrolase-like protein